MTQSSRRALVTGASTAIALALADAGHELIVHAHGHSERAEAVASRIRDSGGQARAIVFDVADAAASRQAVETLIAEQPIQIIVNNAGIHDDAPMAGMSEAQWRRVIDVSLHGFFNVTQPALLAMARTRFGRIVSVSSVAAVLGNTVNYHIGRFPGLIETPMLGESFDAATIKALVPAGRVGKPEEVAALVAFLCSDAAGYINGQVIGINGGMG